jgi:vanillate O-demethylase ferredoxin subunit
LQLTGRAEILWDQDDPIAETGGTRRYWRFEISGWRESILPYRLDWEFMDASPHIPKPIEQTQTNGALQLRVERIHQETDRIKSFRLRAIDGGLLPEFQAGAHLKIKVKLPDGSSAERHYSLLSDPNDKQAYEIGVLLEPEGHGGSRYLHEQVHEGDLIESHIPKNEFPMTEEANHRILIAGGIGITPILSMMHRLASEQSSFELHYSARTNTALAFRDRIEHIAGDRAHFYTSHEPHGQRPSLAHILSTPKPGIHVYVCGPQRMITAVRDTAAARGWPSSQIHFETFGAQPTANDTAFDVHLNKSNKTLTVPTTNTILDTLLEAGVNVPHQCKRGECGLCVTRVLAGEPEHRDFYLNEEERSESMCVCVSRAHSESLTLDL